MHRRSLPLLILIVLADCSAPGVLVEKGGGDDPPHMGIAPQDGTYGLFIAGRAEPMFYVPLKKDQPLGFERAETGTVSSMKIIWLYAVAGNERMRLDLTKPHEWRLLTPQSQ